MVFIKGMQPTKGFTGKKHTDFTKNKITTSQKESYANGRKRTGGRKSVASQTKKEETL